MDENQGYILKILELYAGSRSIGKIGDKLGHEVFSVDLKAFDGINLIQDIEFLIPEQIPFQPDMIWASPPCTTYSLAAISHHRPSGGILSNFAKKSDRLVQNTLKIINHFNCIFYIENPRGLLRKQSFMKGIPRTTIWYCKYGLNCAKPTDIFSNNIHNLFNINGWIPRPICSNGNKYCHHEAAPRGSKTGTQGKKNNYERSKIPDQLCQEIIQQTFNKINHDKKL